MVTSARFWDRAAAKYDARTVKGPNYAARLDRCAGWFEGVEGRGARVLDVGCAGGHIAVDLGPRVGRVHGIDVSPRLVAMAERRAAEAGVANVTFQSGAFETVELEAGAWDGIMAFSVLHLVEDAEVAVRRFAELLRPGGRVVAEVPSRETVAWYFRAIIPLMTAVGKAPVVRIHAESEWASMFTDAGFVVEESKVYNPKSLSVSLLARKA